MTQLLDHNVALEVDGLAYSGWTSVDIDRAIDRMSGTFSLRLASKERTGTEGLVIRDGAECVVTLAGEALITGYVDSVSRFVSPDDRGIEIRGRDRTADLVDCSAVNSPGSWRGRRLEEIAGELVKPFGIPIELEASTGAAFKKFALQQGETVFAAIERMCRYRGLVAWSAGDGILRIGNPDSGQSIGRLVEGSNVLEATGTRDTNSRFSHYIVKGQASGDDERNGAAVAQVRATAEDAGVDRYRPLLIIGEEQSDQSALKRRAEWEAAVRFGRSTPARITVTGWLGANLRPYRPGSRASCSVPSAEIEGELLIERLRFIRDVDTGTFTTFDLVPPEAWAQLPEPVPEQ